MAAAPGAWKWAIRKRIWDTMEATNAADNPRPVHHRIPNFRGADAAAARLVALPEFAAAQVVKINPDTPQKAVRYAALASGKTLLTPQPRLRTGFFNRLRKTDLPDTPDVEALLREASTSAGAAKYGTPLAIDAKDLDVNIVVVGSVAVCPQTGARIGKGASETWGGTPARTSANVRARAAQARALPSLSMVRSSLSAPARSALSF